MNLNLILLKNSYAICRFDNTSSIPEWLSKSDFYSLTRTNDELSIVCNQLVIESGDKYLSDKDWRCFKIDSLLELTLTGS